MTSDLGVYRPDNSALDDKNWKLYVTPRYDADSAYGTYRPS